MLEITWSAQQFYDALRNVLSWRVVMGIVGFVIGITVAVYILSHILHYASGAARVVTRAKGVAFLGAVAVPLAAGSVALEEMRARGWFDDDDEDEGDVDDDSEDEDDEGDSLGWYPNRR